MPDTSMIVTIVLLVAFAALVLGGWVISILLDIRDAARGHRSEHGADCPLY
jgi:hypothetical protein